MLSTNFKRNLRKATTGQRVKEDMSALLVPFVYWTVPTLLGLNNWGGLAAGVGSTWLVGALLDLPGMTSGGLAVGASHVFHSYFRDEFVGVFGKEPWNFLADDPSQFGVYGLHEGQTMLPVPDGRGGYQYVSAYEPTDMPAQGVNDYYYPEGMSDYYTPTDQLMDDYSNFNTGEIDELVDF